jgi:hypothetical protein
MWPDSREKVVAAVVRLHRIAAGRPVRAHFQALRGAFSGPHDPRNGVRESHMSVSVSGQRWSSGASYYPTDGLGSDAIAMLMTLGEMDYDDVEAAYNRRILAYREIIRARTPTRAEAGAFGISDRHPLVEVRRTSHTTSSSVSTVTFRRPL